MEGGKILDHGTFPSLHTPILGRHRDVARLSKGVHSLSRDPSKQSHVTNHSDNQSDVNKMYSVFWITVDLSPIMALSTIQTKLARNRLTYLTIVSSSSPAVWVRG